MAIPYLSEIRIMSFTFAPKGWAQCNGQLVAINQNQALFSLLGTTFGGDGRVNFGLPNLQARTPIHMSSGYPLGNTGGEQAHSLNVGEEPIHTHTAMGTATDADSPVPDGNYLGQADSTYASLANSVPLQSATIANAGGGQPHNNMQPYLVLNFCICLVGAFPSQN